MATQIQLRRDTAANWTSNNPVLASGEAGLETDTGKLKFGNGSTSWTSLAYFAASGAAGGVLSGTYPNPGFAVDMATQAELVAAMSGAVSDGDAAGGVLSGTYPDPGFAVNMATQAELDAATAAAVNDGDAAGGVLSGTYPNPGFAADMATQAELDAAVALKANLASPTLTGDPKAPTPTAGDSDTSIATTAFVQGELASKAPLASPALTGNPTAPTASGGDSDTSIATTAFVQGELAAKAALAGPTFTGDPKAPTPSPGDSDTSIATTAFVTTADGLLVPKSLYTTKGDIAVASAANTPARLGIGAVGQVPMVGQSSVLNYETLSEVYMLPTGWLAATANRRDGNYASVVMAGATGVMVFNPIILRAGQVISSITFTGGTTTAPVAGGTHVWFVLCDSSRVQLATTTDDTAASSWALNTAKTLNIAQIASGASSTYTVPTSGLYYLGFNITATTVGNGIHQTGGSNNLWGGLLTPILAGTGETISTGPPAFPKTYSALTAISKILYGGVQ